MKLSATEWIKACDRFISAMCPYKELIPSGQELFGARLLHLQKIGKFTTSWESPIWATSVLVSIREGKVSCDYYIPQVSVNWGSSERSPAQALCALELFRQVAHFANALQMFFDECPSPIVAEGYLRRLGF